MRWLSQRNHSNLSTKQVILPNSTSGTVIELSAIFVDRMILRPSSTCMKIDCCSSVLISECRMNNFQPNLEDKWDSHSHKQFTSLFSANNSQISMRHGLTCPQFFVALCANDRFHRCRAKRREPMLICSIFYRDF